MSNHIRDYFTASDTVVGEMIEGHYGWNEWCKTHAAEHLARGTSANVNHRPIDIHEVVTSWRPYQCYQCQALLWNTLRPEPAPADPFPKPQGSGIIAELYSE